MGSAVNARDGAASGLRRGVPWFVVVEGLLLLTTAPALLPVLLVERVAASPVLTALLLVPVGPAVSAALFAWRRFGDEPDERPARHFWRGYRLNVVDALLVWVPGLVLLTLLAASLTHLDSMAVPVAFGVGSALVAALVVAWTAHGLVVASLFSFRLRDTVRIAAYFVGAAPRVTVGVLVIAATSVGAVVLGVWWVLPVLGSPLTYLVWRNARPLATVVTRRFVAGAPDAVVAKPWPGLDGVAVQPVDDGAGPAADGEPPD